MTNLSGQRAVVTGGAGFIGSHLVDRLVNSGVETVVIDDFSTGRRENLSHLANRSLLHIEEADVLDEAAMKKLSKGADLTFHLAVQNVRRSLRQPTHVHEVNVTGTLNVLKAASAAGVKRFVYCSSSEVNGTAEVVPMGEDYNFRPETLYGASKLAGEYYALVFHRSGWLSTTVARPHNTYGPRAHYEGPNGEVIPRFILWALAGKPPIIFGDGQQTRDFTYVSETADILVRMATHTGCQGEVLNVCSGEETSILEIANLVLDIVGLDVAPVHRSGRPADVLRLWGDPTRLRQYLGVSPQISVREGLERSIEWFRDNVSTNEETLERLQVVNWEIEEPEEWLRKLSSDAP